MAVADRKLAEALAQADASVREALAFFSVSSGGPALGGGWGPHEVLAHLLYWYDFACRGFEEAAIGGLFPMPRRKIDEINAQVVELNAGRPMADMCRDLSRIHVRLRDAVESLRDPNAVVLIWPDGTVYRAPERLLFAAEHIRSHLRELQVAP